MLNLLMHIFKNKMSTPKCVRRVCEPRCTSLKVQLYSRTANRVNFAVGDSASFKQLEKPSGLSEWASAPPPSSPARTAPSIWFEAARPNRHPPGIFSSARARSPSTSGAVRPGRPAWPPRLVARPPSPECPDRTPSGPLPPPVPAKELRLGHASSQNTSVRTEICHRRREIPLPAHLLEQCADRLPLRPL